MESVLTLASGPVFVKAYEACRAAGIPLPPPRCVGPAPKQVLILDPASIESLSRSFGLLSLRAAAPHLIVIGPPETPDEVVARISEADGLWVSEPELLPAILRRLLNPPAPPSASPVPARTVRPLRPDGCEDDNTPVPASSGIPTLRPLQLPISRLPPPASIPWVHILGGGPMGLLTAIEIADLSRVMGVGVRVRIYEAEALGGGANDRASSPRCQAWFHGGALWAASQPQVTAAILRSRARLVELAGPAFQFPPAFAVQPAGLPDLSEELQILGVPHYPLTPAAVRALVPCPVPDGARVYSVADGTLDIRLLGRGLAEQARRRGVEIVPARASRLVRSGDRLTGIGFADGQAQPVGADDHLIVACGARSRALLATAEVQVEGLRLFQAHLIASPDPQIPALVYYLGGGLNAVPHRLPDGAALCLFGDSRRKELSPVEDGLPLLPDAELIERLQRDAEEVFGCRIPPDSLVSWAGVKTEIVREGSRSQSHHALRLPGVRNGWLGLPGKLTGAAAAGQDLARLVVRELVPEPAARPCWETREPVRIGREYREQEQGMPVSRVKELVDTW